MACDRELTDSLAGIQVGGVNGIVSNTGVFTPVVVVSDERERGQVVHVVGK